MSNASLPTTVIKDADWLVAWDEAALRHVYRRGVDLAFAEDRIVFVGRNYPDPAGRVICGRDRLVLPGLIDIHSHPEHEPLYRGARGARPTAGSRPSTKPTRAGVSTRSGAVC